MAHIKRPGRPIQPFPIVRAHNSRRQLRALVSQQILKNLKMGLRVPFSVRVALQEGVPCRSGEAQLCRRSIALVVGSDKKVHTILVVLIPNCPRPEARRVRQRDCGFIH